MRKRVVSAVVAMLAAAPALAQTAPPPFDPSVAALNQMAVESWHREAAGLLRAYRAEAQVRELQAQVAALQAQLKAACEPAAPAKP